MLKPLAFICATFLATMLSHPSYAQTSAPISEILANIESNQLSAVETLVSDNPKLTSQTAVMLLRAASDAITKSPNLTGDYMNLAAQYSPSIILPAEAKSAAGYVTSIITTIPAVKVCVMDQVDKALKAVLDSSAVIAKGSAVRLSSPQLVAAVDARIAIASEGALQRCTTGDPGSGSSLLTPQTPPGYRLQKSSE